MLTTSEQNVLATFRQYLMTPNKMLCFYGHDLECNAQALESLIEKQLLSREDFKGGYSLTHEGYAEMKQCV